MKRFSMLGIDDFLIKNKASKQQITLPVVKFLFHELALVIVATVNEFSILLDKTSHWVI